MAQDNALYAVARIRCHENGLIGRDRMARMAAGTAEEAMQVLAGAGYGTLADASPADAEALVESELLRTYALVREVSPDPALTDLFLMQADVQNLKMLLKLRLQGGGKPPALMQGGVYDPQALERMVRERDYSELPAALQEALEALEAELVHGADPVRVSVALDSARFAMAYASKNDFAVCYFKALADFENILALLRLSAMGADDERLAAALVPAGDIPHETVLEAAKQPPEQRAKTLEIGPAGAEIRKALDAIAHGAPVTALERSRDNYLIRLADQGRFDIDTVAPIIGYLLAREQEARCIRLILTAKRNGLPEAIITERMRVLYGE